MKYAITIAILIASGCTDPEAAKKTLDDAGYTDIKTQGSAALKCGQGPLSFSNEFTAKNVNGKPVSGAVCCGLILKGCTIRH